jgi:hypothetical protein
VHARAAAGELSDEMQTTAVVLQVWLAAGESMAGIPEFPQGTIALFRI